MAIPTSKDVDQAKAPHGLAKLATAVVALIGWICLVTLSCSVNAGIFSFSFNFSDISYSEGLLAVLVLSMIGSLVMVVASVYVLNKLVLINKKIWLYECIGSALWGLVVFGVSVASLDENFEGLKSYSNNNVCKASTQAYNTGMFFGVFTALLHFVSAFIAFQNYRTSPLEAAKNAATSAV